jgi:DNA-binding NarL/FixJ family response regulator
LHQLSDVMKSKMNLTRREKDVIQLLAKGSSNKDIADSLNISITTVKTHLRNSCKKTSAKNRTDLVIKFLNKQF